MADVLNTGTTIGEVAASNPKNKLGLRRRNGALIFVFVIYSLLCIIPLLLLVMVSFSDEDVDACATATSSWPDHFEPGAYRFLGQDIRSSPAFLRHLDHCDRRQAPRCSMIIIALYAYPISRPNFPQAKFFTFFAFFTMLFSAAWCRGISIYVQLLDLKDTFRCVHHAADHVRRSGCSSRGRSSRRSVPAPCWNRREIDGAGEMRIFFQIVMPLSLPVLATVALFQTVSYWNDWFLQPRVHHRRAQIHQHSIPDVQDDGRTFSILAHKHSQRTPCASAGRSL